LDIGGFEGDWWSDKEEEEEEEDEDEEEEEEWGALPLRRRERGKTMTSDKNNATRSHARTNIQKFRNACGVWQQHCSRHKVAVVRRLHRWHVGGGGFKI
jgi:hypothetical protein